LRLTRIAILLTAVLVVFESCERRGGSEWELPWQTETGSEAGSSISPAEGPESAADAIPGGTAAGEYEYPEEEDPLAGTFREGIDRHRRFDVAATFDTDWHVYSEEERAPFNVPEPGSALKENLVSVMEEGYAWFDLYAEKPADKWTICVSVLALGAEDAALSDEDFARHVAASMPEELASEGLQDISVNTVQIPFLGSSAWGVAAGGRLGETSFFERQIAIRKDGYCAIVTAVSLDRDGTETILGMIRPL